MLRKRSSLRSCRYVVRLFESYHRFSPPASRCFGNCPREIGPVDLFRYGVFDVQYARNVAMYRFGKANGISFGKKENCFWNMYAMLLFNIKGKLSYHWVLVSRSSNILVYFYSKIDYYVYFFWSLNIQVIQLFMIFLLKKRKKNKRKKSSLEILKCGYIW